MLLVEIIVVCQRREFYSQVHLVGFCCLSHCQAKWTHSFSGCYLRTNDVQQCWVRTPQSLPHEISHIVKTMSY